MSQPAPPEPRRLAASHGMGWLLQTLSLLRQQAGRLLLIALVMQVVMGLTQLQLVGLLVVLAVPALNAGILESFHLTARGGQPRISTLFGPLMSRGVNVRLLMLGALVFAVGVISMSLLLSGSEELTDPMLLERIERGDLDTLMSLKQESLRQMVLAFLLGVSISGTLSYFSVPLIWFRGQRMGTAVITGLRALVVNWRPFLVLGFGLLLVILPVAVLGGVMFSISGTGGAVAVIMMGFIMVLLLLFQLVLFGTQYCAFRDVFGPEQDATLSADDDAQLVA